MAKYGYPWRSITMVKHSHNGAPANNLTHVPLWRDNTSSTLNAPSSCDLMEPLNSKLVYISALLHTDLVHSVLSSIGEQSIDRLTSPATWGDRVARTCFTDVPTHVYETLMASAMLLSYEMLIRRATASFGEFARNRT